MKWIGCLRNDSQVCLSLSSQNVHRGGNEWFHSVYLKHLLSTGNRLEGYLHVHCFVDIPGRLEFIQNPGQVVRKHRESIIVALIHNYPCATANVARFLTLVLMLKPSAPSHLL